RQKTFERHWRGNGCLSKIRSGIPIGRNKHGKTETHNHGECRPDSLSPVLRREAGPCARVGGSAGTRQCGTEAHRITASGGLHATAIGRLGRYDGLSHLSAGKCGIRRTFPCHAESDRGRLEAARGNSLCSGRARQSVEIGPMSDEYQWRRFCETSAAAGRLSVDPLEPDSTDNRFGRYGSLTSMKFGTCDEV